MLTHKTNYRVIYGDTDQMGVVYYGNYASLYEIGRTEMIRSLGVSYKEIEGWGIMLPVKKMECEFIQSARYDDLLTIKTTIKQMPTAKLEFYYEIYNQDGLLLNKGYTKLAFLNMETGKVTRAPKKLLEILEKQI